MNQTTATLTAAFGAVVLGLAILLISGVIGVSEPFIMVSGIVVLTDAGVPTDAVIRLPGPNEGEHGSDGDHA